MEVKVKPPSSKSSNKESIVDFDFVAAGESSWTPSEPQLPAVKKVTENFWKVTTTTTAIVPPEPPPMPTQPVEPQVIGGTIKTVNIPGPNTVQFLPPQQVAAIITPYAQSHNAWRPQLSLKARWKDLPKAQWVQHYSFQRGMNNASQHLQTLVLITKIDEDSPFMELRLISNETTGEVIYALDGTEISCSTMADILYSILPALECLPLSIVEGPFKELDELLRRDSSIEERENHNRFNDLEIEYEGNEDTTGNSTGDTQGD